MGVAQLEVPAAGQSRRNDLRALDAHPEASPGRRRADSHRGLAGGRTHERRGAVCGRRGWSQREAQGAGRPASHRRSHAGRAGANACSSIAPAARPPPGCLHRGGRFPSTTRRSYGHDRGCCALRARRKDRRRQATAQAPPADKPGARSRRSAGRSGCAGSNGRGRAPAAGARARGRQRFRIPSLGRPPEPGHQASPPPVGYSEPTPLSLTLPPEGGREARRVVPGPRCIRSRDG